MERTLLAPPRDRDAARQAVRRPVRSRRRRRRAAPSSIGRADRGGDRRRPEPRRGPDPAQLPVGRARDPAHQLLPHRRRRASRRPLPARSSSTRRRSRSCRCRGRGSRSSSTRRGSRASTCAAARSRAAACAGRTAGGLPHRDPRPDEGADGQERADRARSAPRAASWSSARPPRAAARRCRTRRSPATRRSCRGLLDLTDNIVGGDVVPPAAGGPLRRRRPVPRRRGRQGHGDVLRHRQRGLGRLRLLARRRVRLGRLAGLRPQGDGDHRPGGVGVGQAPLPRARHRHPDDRLHRRRDRRHVRRRVRQRDAALATHQAARRVQPHARVPRSRPRSRERASTSASGCSSCGRSSWSDYDPSADLRGRRGLRAHREVDPDLRRRSRRRSGSRRTSSRRPS